jgi:putative glutamine amidotransferase
MSKKPVIGVTLDSEEGGGYSPLPWYALRKEYFAAIVRAGGVPFGLPHEPSMVEEYLGRIDGLLLTGGDVDIPPEMYGAANRHDKVTLKEGRTAFEVPLAIGALKRDMPVLGVCAGEQLLNVLLGGTLYQHIPDEVQNALEHQQPTPRTQPWHDVFILENSLLHKIVGKGKMSVNSNHHQAVKDVGAGVVISAKAPDGVPEAIESISHKFVLGIEWHPELQVDPADKNIIEAFVFAAL